MSRVFAWILANFTHTLQNWLAHSIMLLVHNKGGKQLPKKEEAIDWIGAPEVIEILEKNNRREVHPNYLSYLGRKGRIARKRVDKRSYLYSKQDAERVLLIRRKGAGRKRSEDTDKRPAVNIVPPALSLKQKPQQ